MTKDRETEILLVEDNSDDLELTLHALRSNKVVNKIEVARDGEEALDFFFCRGRFADRPRNVQPNLVLLDLKLPKLGGFEVLRELRKDLFLRTVPVVILTSSKEERDLVTGYQLGVNSYIQKPVDFKQFRDTVRQLGLYWLVVNEPPPLGAQGAI